MGAVRRLLPACEGDAAVASTVVATPSPDPQNITRCYPLPPVSDPPRSRLPWLWPELLPRRQSCPQSTAPFLRPPNN
ncbi:unnamed protein product [Urochloa humidicola]